MNDNLTHEEFKILQYFFKHKKLSMDDFNQKYPLGTAKRASAISLVRYGYIKQPLQSDRQKLKSEFIITDSGRIAYAHYKSNKRFFTPEYFLSHVLIPLIVGVASAVITAIILS